MSVSMKTRRVNDVVVLDLSGRLVMGEATLLFREAIRRYIADGNRRFVINLGEVSYVDSAGLGELVATYTTIRKQGGDVKLLNLTTKMKDLLQITKLLTVFETFENEGEAVRSLESWKRVVMRAAVRCPFDQSGTVHGKRITRSGARCP